MKQSCKRFLCLLCALTLACSCALAQSAPPEMPDGNGTPPDMPAGDNGGTPPDMPDGNGTPPDMPAGGMPGGQPGGQASQGTSATTFAEDTNVSNSTFTSPGDNENALRATGDIDVLVTDAVIEKSGGATSSTEDSDFYGQNAGFLATDGANVTIKNTRVTTNAAGGNAVFSYGAGTSVTISDSVIRTGMNNSGGIHVTGGGTLTASNLDVQTQGNSAAAIRSDRGGGTLVADGGSYVTGGTGSPSIYCTAEITVKNATLTANRSEAVVVEGKNSVTLENCAVSGCMEGTYGANSDENIHGVMIYQSMSGDADVGQSRFTMAGGSLKTLAGDLFYVTNTSCVIELSEVSLALANENLLQVVGNSGDRGWGKAGENGGKCVLTASHQTMSGNITVDSISSLELALTGDSSYTGAINQAGPGGAVSVTLEAGSLWTLTADSYITSFTGDMADVDLNGYTLNVAE